MSAGFQFLAPAGLLLGLLALPILLLYMLKLRRRQVQVSSTLLWQILLRDRQANTPWQKLRRNLLLFLQLLILAALVLAMARPALPAPSLASGSLVIVLDGSASMQAVDGGSNTAGSNMTRFEAARQAASDLAASLPGTSNLTLILAGPQPQTLVSAETDPNAIQNALAVAAPGAGAADWASAFALAAGAARSAGEDATIVLISDGGLPPARTSSPGIPPLPVPLRYIPIGHSRENVAISAFAVRPGAAGPELFAAVTNHGALEHTVILSLYADEQLFHAQELTLSPGERRSLVWDALPPAARFRGALTSPGATPGAPDPAIDALPLDDQAFAVVYTATTGRVLLVTAGNFFLERLLASLPEIQSFRATPEADGSLPGLEDASRGDFDLYIFDKVLPPELPPADLLLIDPPTNSLFTSQGMFTNTLDAIVADHPLTRYVSWEQVHVRQAQNIQPPPWATVLVQAAGGPLVLAGETQGRRVGVLTFDLQASDLPLQVDFPILFSNLINWLSRSSLATSFARAQLAETGSLQTGQSLTLRPPPGAEGVEIYPPTAGRSPTPIRLGLNEAGAFFSDIQQPGFYRVHYTGPAAPADEYFAANLFAPQESAIQPAAQVQVSGQAVAPATQNATGQRELWPYLAALGLLVLMIEWWVYHGRGQVKPLLG